MLIERRLAGFRFQLVAMILAPIDGRQFSRACRSRSANPASCRAPQLFRLTLLAVVGGLLVFVALGGKSARAEPAASAMTVLAASAMSALAAPAMSALAAPAMSALAAL
jgi:hypothetical protein